VIHILNQREKLHLFLSPSTRLNDVFEKTD
jgi:hypothetical protein